jgi:hypothetical protein
MNSSPQPKRDINAVLEDHDDALLQKPGVEGVYVGVLEDGKTPCLHVMLGNEEGSKSIPPEIEGYPVVTEVPGRIRPLQDAR